LPSKKEWGIGIAVVAIAIIVVGVFIWDYTWKSTHYEIGPGQVAIVTDAIGGYMRAEIGPKDWAEKASWEHITLWESRVHTEEMISPAEEIDMNGTIVTIMHPEPLGTEHGYGKDLRYGAATVNSKDGIYNIYVDLTATWHLDTSELGWQERIGLLYLDYPHEDYDTGMLYPKIREYVRSYASKYTLNEIVYTEQAPFAEGMTIYVREKISEVITLHNAVVIDEIAVRKRMPPPNVQIQNLALRSAQIQAEAILTIANASRDAAIRVKEGQAKGIELVVNATTDAMNQLLSQNMSSMESINYLGLQYMFDSLRDIAENYPEWKLSIFVNAPQATYTIPISQED